MNRKSFLYQHENSWLIVNFVCCNDVAEEIYSLPQIKKDSDMVYSCLTMEGQMFI